MLRCASSGSSTRSWTCSGVSCCQGDEFGEAVAFVERNSARVERLITQEFPLERAPEALRWAMEHPADAMKVVIGDIE